MPTHNSPASPTHEPLDARRLGPFIAEVRAERSLTQRALAERLYVSDKTVSKWERGLSLPSVPLLMPLAEALGISISELMCCERAAHEAPVERAEADRLIAASLGLSHDRDRARARRARLAVTVLVTCAWAAQTAHLVFARNLDTLERALADPSVSCGLALLVVAAWFSFFSPETLPGYYDKNRLSWVAQGPLRLNLSGFVRIHNGNWPALCRAARVSALAVVALLPAVEIAAGGALPDKALVVAALACFFVPVLAAAKRAE